MAKRKFVKKPVINKSLGHKPKFDFLIFVFCAVALISGSSVYYFLHYVSTSKVSHVSTVIDEPLHVTLPPGTPRVTNVSGGLNDYVIPPIVNGLAPVISSLPTKEKVVFLGIDDGANKQPFELELMRTNHVVASLFLANSFIYNNPQFFARFISEGSLVEDHTLNHKLLSKLTYDEQKQEICGEADIQFKEFGRRPILFRPPGGDYNTDTQRAAADCGMKAVVMWIAKANGGSMQYQVGHSLQPGDIVLMHFRPEFQSDMQAFLNAQNSAGLHTELLENWLN